MTSQPKTTPKKPADIKPTETDPVPDTVKVPDPIVESIEDRGEPSLGNFA